MYLVLGGGKAGAVPSTAPHSTVPELWQDLQSAWHGEGGEGSLPQPLSTAAHDKEHYTAGCERCCSQLESEH